MGIIKEYKLFGARYFEEKDLKLVAYSDYELGTYDIRNASGGTNIIPRFYKTQNGEVIQGYKVPSVETSGKR